MKRLHARQGSPSTRGTLSTCPGDTATRDSFLSCKLAVPAGLSRLTEVRSTSRENMAVRGDFFCSRHLPVLSVEHVMGESQAESRPVPVQEAEIRRKKFLWSAILFVVLSDRSKDNSRSPFTVPVR